MIGAKEGNDVIIIDHKTKSAASMKKEYQLYRKQLYLYAIWLKEEYGDYPTKLAFNMVKEGSMIEETFDPAMVEETKQWFLDGIHEIEACDTFEDWHTCITEKEMVEAKEPYFCKNICGVNPSCEQFQDIHYRAVEEWKARKAAEEAMALGY